MKKIRRKLTLLLTYSLVLLIFPNSAINASPKISLNKQKITLGIGQTCTLKLKNYKKAKKNLKWYSTNKDTATVSQKGKVRGYNPGKAKIVVKAGKKKYFCTVIVKDKTKRTKYKGSNTTPNPTNNSISNPTNTSANTSTDKPTGLYVTEVNPSLSKGETFTFQAYNLPVGTAAKRTITWSSSNPSVATVVNGTVTAISPGSTLITISDGEYSIIRTVTVKASIESITFSLSEKTLYINDSFVLTGSVLPIGVNCSELIWKTSDSTIATVTPGIGVATAYATISAKGIGSAIITAQSPDGKCVASCTITVINPIELSLPKTPAILHSYSYNNSIYQICKITSIRYEVSKNYSDDKYQIKLYLDGEKTYDSNGASYSREYPIAWKLYSSENTVQGSGTAYTVSLAEDELFSNKEITIYNVPAGNYTFELNNSK